MADEHPSEGQESDAIDTMDLASSNPLLSACQSFPIGVETQANQKVIQICMELCVLLVW